MASQSRFVQISFEEIEQIKENAITEHKNSNTRLSFLKLGHFHLFDNLQISKK
jgi:hypothetical protein